MGDRDTTLHPENGERIIEQSAKATSPATKVLRGRVPDGHAYTRTIVTDQSGWVISEHWNVHGAGHAWSGGSPVGPTPIREGQTRQGKCCVSSSRANCPRGRVAQDSLPGHQRCVPPPFFFLSAPVEPPPTGKLGAKGARERPYAGRHRRAARSDKIRIAKLADKEYTLATAKG